MADTTDNGWRDAGDAPAAVLDLRPVLASLYARRLWIGVGTVLGILAGLAVWFGVGTTYAGLVTLAVTPPRSAPNSPTALTVASYRALIENRSVSAQAIANAGLTYHGAPMTPERFLRRVLSVEEVANTTLFRVRVKLGEPNLAAAVANDVARLALALAQQMNQEEGTTLRAQLKEQLDEAVRNLDAAKKQLLDFKSASQIELLRTDVEAFIKEREKLAGIEVELSGENARATAATKELATREATIKLDRRIDQDPTMLEAARAQAGADPRGLIGLGLRTEEPNPTYLRMDREAALSKARIPQLERERQEILNASAALKSAGKLTDLYAKEVELTRLQSDLTLARKLYEDVALRYEQARVVVTSGSAQLQVVDPALPTTMPVSWSVWIWLALGALAGAALPIAFVVTTAVARQFVIGGTGTP